MFEDDVYKPTYNFYGTQARIYELKRGDIIVVDPAGMRELTGTNKEYKVGAILSDKGTYIIRVYYTPKKKWQFWKRKRVIAYKIVWKE